jgi:xanthine dehydrogenase large subunit
VPNASATAASSGSDMNGKAAQQAAGKIRARLTEFAAAHFNVAESKIGFADNQVTVGKQKMAFEELVQLAWFNRVSPSVAGRFSTTRTVQL